MARVLIIPLVFVSSMMLLACGGDPLPEPEQARVQFLHNIDDLGNLEVLLDNEPVLTIRNGQLSEVAMFEPGRHRLSIRNQGAQSALTAQTIDFEVQGYLLVFTGSYRDNTIQALIVDNAPPAQKQRMAAVEVVNLYEGRYEFDVYVGTDLVASELTYGLVTEFEEIEADTLPIRVYNTGDNPSDALPVASAQHTFKEGEATLIMLQNDDLAVSVSLIPIR